MLARSRSMALQRVLSDPKPASSGVNVSLLHVTEQQKQYVQFVIADQIHVIEYLAFHCLRPCMGVHLFYPRQSFRVGATNV